MNRDKIYYLGTYDTPFSDIKRRFTVSATTKMDYIISALNQSGFNVEVISTSYMLERKWAVKSGEKKRINEYTTLSLNPTFGGTFFFIRHFAYLFSIFCFFYKLLKLKKTDILIVYHALWFSTPVRLAKFFKGFQLILEVEEVYAHAFNRGEKYFKKELKLITAADKYILVNDLIGDILHLDKQKIIICYGPYFFNLENSAVAPFDDGKIHLVYAGSFSTAQGGAYNAIKSARYLSENYLMHILGYGSKNEEDELHTLIEDINRQSQCQVLFEGLKNGLEFYAFMKKCNIGLNPQKWGDYMLYAYPSKVLMYLSLNLNIISSPIETVRASTIHPYITYMKLETPESLAEAIMNAKIYSKNELALVIKQLNDQFVKDINTLIKS